MDESLYSHFIRGYFDGDGCISKTGRGAKCNIVSSYDFCIYLSKFLEEKLDIYSVVYHAENPQTGRLFINRKDDTKKFVDYMYKNADLYMNRKHDIYIKKFYSEKT
jgi:intein-encoded DNA endonuclease-like protein